MGLRIAVTTAFIIVAALAMPVCSLTDQGPLTPARGAVGLGVSSSTVTGGNTVDLTVALGDVVDDDTTVSLSSSPTSAFANLPSSVVIPSGNSYVVITVTTATVSTTVNATVTGSATNYTTGTCGLAITP